MAFGKLRRIIMFSVAAAISLALVSVTVYQDISHPPVIKSITGQESLNYLDSATVVEYKNVTYGGSGLMLMFLYNTPTGKVHSLQDFTYSISVLAVANASPTNVAISIHVDTVKFGNSTPQSPSGAHTYNSGSKLMIYYYTAYFEDLILPQDSQLNFTVNLYSSYGPYYMKQDSFKMAV